MAEEFATFFSPLKEERSTPPKTQTTTPLTAMNNPKSQKRLRGLPLEERPVRSKYATIGAGEN